MSYGELLFTAGLILAGGGGISLLVGTAVYAAKRKKLRKKLFDKYGF